MRAAFVTSYDSENIANWSGLGFHIAKSLESQGIELIRVNCFVRFSLLQRVMKKMIGIFSRKIWQLEREKRHLRKMAGRVTEQLAGKEYDLVFCAGSLPVSFLESGKPVVFFTDATYGSLMDLYVGRNKICKRSLQQGNMAEQRAIQKASLIFYTSDWAIQDAVTTYHALPQKIVRLPFGANLKGRRTTVDIMACIQRRLSDSKKNFLFIGIGWKRKGAPLAIQTVVKLKEAGIDATLTIVGPGLPKGFQLPGFVEYYPFISKAEEAGMKKLDTLFKKAHFFLLPTEADCTPVVFSEAASYGLPVITTCVGGCTSVVIDGLTGYCIEKEGFVDEAVRRLVPLCRDEARYEAFCRQSFNYYEKEFDWDVIGKKVETSLRLLVKDREPVPVRHT